MNHDEFQRNTLATWKKQDRAVLTRYWQSEIAISLEKNKDPDFEVKPEQMAAMDELGLKYLQLLAIQGHARMRARENNKGSTDESDTVGTAIETNLNMRFTLLNQQGKNSLPGPLFGKVIRASMEAARKGFAELYNQETLGLRVPRDFAVAEAIDIDRGGRDR